MEDWIQVIIVIAGMILTAQQSHKRNKRKKRMAAVRKAAVNPTVILGSMEEIECQPEVVLQQETPPILQDALPSEYAVETHESPTIRESASVESDTQQSFNVFDRSHTAQEKRMDSVRNVVIASTSTRQPEQYRDTENADFDLRQAIIYSEILTPKFKDYF